MFPGIWSILLSLESETTPHIFTTVILDWRQMLTSSCETFLELWTKYLAKGFKFILKLKTLELQFVTYMLCKPAVDCLPNVCSKQLLSLRTARPDWALPLAPTIQVPYDEHAPVWEACQVVMLRHQPLWLSLSTLPSKSGSYPLQPQIWESTNRYNFAVQWLWPKQGDCERCLGKLWYLQLCLLYWFRCTLQ